MLDHPIWMACLSEFSKDRKGSLEEDSLVRRGCKGAACVEIPFLNNFECIISDASERIVAL